MRAVVYDRYGPPDVLRLEEVERPVPKEDEVLVKIHATTVNRSDCGTREANRRGGLALWTARIGDKRVVFPIPPRYTKKDVLFIKDLIEAGKYRAVIDRCYPLEQVVDATRYVETQKKRGNVVLTVSDSSTPSVLIL